MPLLQADGIAGMYDEIAALKSSSNLWGIFVAIGMLDWMILISRRSLNPAFSYTHNAFGGGEDIVILIANLIRGGIQNTNQYQQNQNRTPNAQGEPLHTPVHHPTSS